MRYPSKATIEKHKKLHERLMNDKDYSKAIKGEQEAQVEYEELAEEHPEHQRSIKEIQHDEKTHETKLKRLKATEKKHSDYHTMNKLKQGWY